MESDLNYRDEYEKLQESRGQMEAKRGVSINIKTKGTISRPQSSKPFSNKSGSSSRKELYAWHSRPHIPLVSVYNPQKNILPPERIEHLVSLAARRAGLIEKRNESKAIEDEV